MNWQVGQSLPVLVKPKITAEQLREYAQASGDRNPIHLDEAFARNAGFPSVIVHGMLCMAFMGDHVLSVFSEPQFRLEELKARFKKVTFPGDTLTCEGEIKKIEGEGRFTLSLRSRNQAGEITAEGEAVVRRI